MNLRISKSYRKFKIVHLGHQGQVERMNSTLKKMLTKDLLGHLEVDIEEGRDFEDMLFTSRNWVEKLQKMADVYNNTPKAVTKVTPMEVHFPGQTEASSKYFVLNEEDARIVDELRQVCLRCKKKDMHSEYQYLFLFIGRNSRRRGRETQSFTEDSGRKAREVCSKVFGASTDKTSLKDEKARVQSGRRSFSELSYGEKEVEKVGENNLPVLWNGRGGTPKWKLFSNSLDKLPTTW
jgi:hypothetical protein